MFRQILVWCLRALRSTTLTATSYERDGLADTMSMREFDCTVLANISGPCIGQWDNLTSLLGPGSRSCVMVLEAQATCG